MKIVFTEPALSDIEDIRAYLAVHYPHVAPSVERRLRIVLTRIARWPESAPPVAERPGVRVVSLVRYPYKVFYHVKKQRIEILHIYHAARE